jgi:hypothetical protein
MRSGAAASSKSTHYITKGNYMTTRELIDSLKNTCPVLGEAKAKAMSLEIDAIVSRYDSAPETQADFARVVGLTLSIFKASIKHIAKSLADEGATND